MNDSKRIFPGWYAAGALSACGIALYGAGLYSFILFVTPLSNEFHWSRAAVGSLVSAFWLACPLVLVSDRLLARFGPRRLILTGIVIEATCLMMLFSAAHLWEMYLLRALTGLGKILYAISIPAVLSRWFSRRFGLALAIAYCGWQVGGLALAPVAQDLIATLGWRAASVVLGVIVLVIALPSTLWFLRVPSAAALGLGLDGDGLTGAEPAETSSHMHLPVIEGRKLLREVLRNRHFLLISLGTAIYCISYSGVLAHQAAAVESFGISAREASLLVAGTAGSAVLGSLIFGWLIDRYSLALTTIALYGATALGIACLLGASRLDARWLPLLHALFFGLSVGGLDIFWITSLKRRLPERLFPTAYGVCYFLALAATVVGPIVAGLLYDLSGSYVGSLTAELLNLIAPFIMALTFSILPPSSVLQRAPA